MDKQLYRVVLTGELASGFSREAVIAALARLFEVSAGQLVGIFDGREYPIDEALDAHEASALQQRLEKLGARARIELANVEAKAANLHLPQHEASSSAGLMRCPACGHQQLVARQCDECGVVFAEFNRRRAAGGATAASPQPASPAPRQAKPAKPAKPRAAAGSADIHARDTDTWHKAWVDDGDDLPTEQYHINLFMGPRSGHLSTACNRWMLGRRTQLSLSWAGGAVFSPFLWAMYRKMWGWGSLIFVCEILVPLLLITLGNKDGVSDKLTYLGLAAVVGNRLFWPAVAKYLYCRHARNTIAYMNRMSPTYASDIDIATAGGTSRTSVFLGMVMAIVVSLLAWSIADTLHARFMRAAPSFSVPEASLPQPGWQPTPVKPAAPEVATVSDDVLANENKWVSTRNKLRLLGQRVSTWFAASAAIDPKRLNMADIGQALLLDSDSTVDGWGKQIAYRYEGEGYLLVSAGPDGAFGTTDDIEYRRSLQR